MTRTTVAPATPSTTRAAPILAILLAGQAMASMDGSIAAVAAPAIRADLAAPAAVQQLVLVGYTLAFAVLVVTGARLGARHGYARIFRLGLAGFTAASLACGIAPWPTVLVAARIVQGAAAALMVPQVLALIHRRLTGRARERAIGAYSAVLALGVAGGQIIGGLLVTVNLGDLSWRTAFLVNVPIGLVLLAAAPRYLSGGGDRDDEHRLDLVGVLTLSGAMVAVVLPLVAGREFGWPAWLWAVLICAGGALMAAFLRHERRPTGSTAPLIDPGVLATPGVPAGLTASFVVMGCYAAFLFALTLRLQDGLGLNALAAGLAFVPYAAGFALCSLSAPRIAPRFSGALPVAGPLVFAAAAVAVAVLSWPGWSWLWCSPLLALAGAGHAAGFSPLVARMSAGIPAAAAASLSALISMGALLANVLGVAGIGAAYLAVAESAQARSAAGFAVTAAIAACLLAIGGLAASRAPRAVGRVAREAGGR